MASSSSSSFSSGSQRTNLLLNPYDGNLGNHHYLKLSNTSTDKDTIPKKIDAALKTVLDSFDNGIEVQGYLEGCLTDEMKIFSLLQTQNIVPTTKKIVDLAYIENGLKHVENQLEGYVRDCFEDSGHDVSRDYAKSLLDYVCKTLPFVEKSKTEGLEPLFRNSNNLNTYSIVRKAAFENYKKADEICKRLLALKNRLIQVNYPSSKTENRGRRNPPPLPARRSDRCKETNRCLANSMKGLSSCAQKTVQSAKNSFPILPLKIDKESRDVCLVSSVAATGIFFVGATLKTINPALGGALGIGTGLLGGAVSLLTEPKEKQE